MTMISMNNEHSPNYYTLENFALDLPIFSGSVLQIIYAIEPDIQKTCVLNIAMEIYNI